MRKCLISGILFIIGIWLLYAILSSLGRFVKVSDFKNFAEGRLGDLLKAKVHVGEVRVGFLDQISLNGLKINQQIQNKVFYLLDIDKVVFKYNLGRFWQRDFKNPNTVLLDSPQFTFQSANSVTAFEINKVLKEGSRLTDELEFKEGKVTLQVPLLEAACDLTQLHGKFKRIEGETWRINLEGRVKQLFEGSVSAEGTVDLDRADLSVRVFLNRLKSLRPDFPVKSISGVMEVTTREVHIEKFAFEYNRLPVEVSGWVRNFDTVPQLDLDVRLGKETFRSVFKVQGALTGSELKGEIGLSGKGFPVSGRLEVSKTGFSLENLRIADLFDSQGTFDFSKGTFRFYLERDKQRVDLSLNLQRWNIDFLMQVDHLSFFGADLVSRAHFRLKPNQELWDQNEWGFDGEIKTDYLILDQAPFPDFKGTFHVTDARIERMDFYWGEGYSLAGNLDLKPPFPLDAALTLRSIQLGQMKSLCARPLPENFTGIASGDVKLRGENWRAQVEGAMTVEQGSIGNIDYDQVSLHFYGFPPYLKLRDSRLKKGMRTFYLDGGLDLASKNVFHDVRAASSEKILIWSGKELTTSERQISAVKRKISGSDEQEDESVAVGPRFNF